MYRRTWRRGRPSIYASYVIARAIEDPWRLWSMRELGEDIFKEMVESGEDMSDRTPRHVIDALNRRRVHYRPDEDSALPECGDETVLIREKGMRIETNAWYAWRWALSYEEQHWSDEAALEQANQINKKHAARVAGKPLEGTVELRKWSSFDRVLAGLQLACALFLLTWFSFKIETPNDVRHTDISSWPSAHRVHQIMDRTRTIYSIGKNDALKGYLEDPGPASSQVVGVCQLPPPF